MKKIVLAIMALAIAAFPQQAFAKSGGQVVQLGNTFYNSSTHYYKNHLWLTNVTGSDIDVTITYYDDTGAAIQDGDDSKTGGSIRNSRGTVTNWDDNASGASASFTLAANDTTNVTFQPTTAAYGYAVIEWSQSSDEINGLLAAVEFEYYANYSSFNYYNTNKVFINEGRPF